MRAIEGEERFVSESGVACLTPKPRTLGNLTRFEGATAARVLTWFIITIITIIIVNYY